MSISKNSVGSNPDSMLDNKIKLNDKSVPKENEVYEIDIEGKGDKANAQIKKITKQME